MDRHLGWTIRPARFDDAAAIAAIYAHHVVHGAASFDTSPKSDAEMRERIALCRERGWPFLVADLDGEILGYAYASQFRDRPAYASTCENSIYVSAPHVGQGLGTALLHALVEAAQATGFRQMIAVIGGPEPASAALHRKAGFREAGRMRSVGWKFGRWLDSVYMQRELGTGDRSPPAVEP